MDWADIHKITYLNIPTSNPEINDRSTKFEKAVRFRD